MWWHSASLHDENAYYVIRRQVEVLFNNNI